MNLLFFIADGYNEYNSSNFRVTIPATAIKNSGKAGVKIMSVREWMAQTSAAKTACAWADIIILQRVLIEESVKHTQHWKARGKKILLDFDDAYDLIRDDNAAYKFWGKGEIDIRLSDGHIYQRPLDNHPMAQFRESLPLIDGIVTPSRVLSKDWEPYTRAYYIPNYLDLPRYDKYKKITNPYTVIAWGGSLSHVPSFSGSGVAWGLRQAMVDCPETRFLLIGDMRVKEHIRIPTGRLLTHTYVKASEWPALLKRYDIGLAPLYDKYDCRRSHLKVMEYAALGIPFVATRSAVYSELFDAAGIFVDQGDLTVCDQQNDAAWYQAIKNIAQHYDEYVDMALAKRGMYRELHDVNNNVDYMLQVYEEVLNI